MVGAVAAGAAVVALARSGAPSPFQSTTVRAASPGELTTDEAKVGSVYNLGVTLRVSGPQPVTFLGLTVEERTAGLDVLPGALMWGCDGAEVFGALVADDLARVPTARVAPSPVLRESEGDCYYGLIRLRPIRKGQFTASGGVLRYRIGEREESASFDFTTVLSVTGAGPDPRDKSR